MKTKYYIKTNDGVILFEYQKLNNSMKDTVIEASRLKVSLSKADLHGIDITNSFLLKTNFAHSNLSNTNFIKSDLRNSDFSGADLSNANFHNADLRNCKFNGANLSNANFSRADLSNADFSKADLSGINIFGANLHNVILHGVKGLTKDSLWYAQTRILPEGDIIGYKKCRDNIIVKLLIPQDAKRSHGFDRQCKSEFAKVLEIYGSDEAISIDDNSFVYRVGKTVRPKKPFVDDWLNGTSSGIYFFITRVEAEYYNRQIN